MDDILTLLLLSLAMLVGCYLAGVIPLAISLSEEKLKLVTVLGAGLLVGTALAVIIPEGINAMYTSESEHSHESHHKIAEKSLEKTVQKADNPVAGKDNPSLDHVGHDHVGHDHHGHSHGLTDTHTIIGVTLVSGFIFMLLVDQIGGSHMHQAPDTEAGQQVTTQQNRNKITATVGLVVHAAADGVALGAAINMAHTHLTLIVFIAIMLHKAPAAFGLVSFLLHEGFDRPRIRKHLFVFAAAAPLLAVITYICLSQKSAENLQDFKTTGIAMLFSAGTFLYVATVHVLPEVSSSQTKRTSPDGTVVIHQHKGFHKSELLAIILGAVLPVILSIGHSH